MEETRKFFSNQNKNYDQAHAKLVKMQESQNNAKKVPELKMWCKKKKHVMENKKGGNLTYECDNCKKEMDPDEYFWRCGKCDYDLCKDCAIIVNEKPKEERPDEQILNRVLPPVTYDTELDHQTMSKEMYMVIIGHVDGGKSTLMG